MPKILVTGGLGYIGSHTVVELLENNFEVVIVDDLSNSEAFILDKITKITGKKVAFEQIDLKDKEATEKVISKYSPNGIIHFAAYKAVGESTSEPLMYYENNLVTLINVLKAITKNGLDNLIYSSSCTVYGQAEKMPVNENESFKKDISPYGKTKQMGENILSDFVKAKKKNITVLRYFNPIGAHPSGLIGELPKGVPNNLIPYISQTAIGIRKELKIFGNDYPTKDGTAIRDYIYICDLAKAHVTALKKLLESKKTNSSFSPYNLGTGSGKSVLEVVQEFEKSNDLKLNYSFEKRREGDITEAYADCSKANRELNWKAETTFSNALKTAWEWEKNLKKQKD